MSRRILSAYVSLSFSYTVYQSSGFIKIKILWFQFKCHNFQCLLCVCTQAACAPPLVLVVGFMWGNLWNDIFQNIELKIFLLGYSFKVPYRSASFFSDMQRCQLTKCNDKFKIGHRNIWQQDIIFILIVFVSFVMHEFSQGSDSNFVNVS